MLVWKNSGLVLCWVGGLFLVAGWEEAAYRKCQISRRTSIYLSDSVFNCRLSIWFRLILCIEIWKWMHQSFFLNPCVGKGILIYMDVLGMRLDSFPRHCRRSESFTTWKLSHTKRVQKKTELFSNDFILQHFNHCSIQSSLPYWRYTVTQRIFHCWNASWNALSVMARSSLIAFSRISACSKKTELFK